MSKEICDPQMVPLILFAMLWFFMGAAAQSSRALGILVGAGALLMTMTAVSSLQSNGMPFDMISGVTGYVVGYILLPRRVAVGRKAQAADE